MKSIVLMVSIVMGLAFSAQAADVVCGCEDGSCKDVEINFVPSNPGVYLSVNFNDGNKTVEGLAMVTTDKENETVAYSLGRFILIKKDKEYSMPNSGRVCK